jgi:hypothetical protein
VYDCGHHEQEVEMKVQATVALSFQAASLAAAGTVLDDVLARARERDDVDVSRVEVVSPPADRPVMLPGLPAAPTGFAPPAPPRPEAANGA